jgi:hypothetical protein
MRNEHKTALKKRQKVVIWDTQGTYEKIIQNKDPRIAKGLKSLKEFNDSLS